MKFTCIDELNVYSSNHRKLIKRSVLRGERLDEDCKRANTTTEADLIVCYGLQDNAENLLEKCKNCKALVWNCEQKIIQRLNEAWTAELKLTNNTKQRRPNMACGTKKGVGKKPPKK